MAHAEAVEAPASILHQTAQPHRLTTAWMNWYTENMNRGEPLNVDLGDPAAIQTALTRAEQEVMRRRAELKQAATALNHWETLYHRLSILAGKPSQTASLAEGSVRKRVERVVNESESPVDVDRVLTLVPGAERKTVSWNLWDLDRRGKIQKLSPGVYAPLAYRRPQDAITQTLMASDER